MKMLKRIRAGLLTLLATLLLVPAMAGSLSDYTNNFLIDGWMRGGALGTGGAVNSTAVVKGVWTASTSYSLGDIVVPHANMTGAGGKFLLCTTAGTSGSTNTLAVPNPGSTLTDNTVTWTAVSGMPSLYKVYVALMTAAPTDSGGGTEVSGGSYARVAVTMSMANWSGTQSTGSTTSSTGTGGRTSNNGSISFPTPTAGWGTVTTVAVYDQATGGNLLFWQALAASKTINSGDTVNFSANALGMTFD